MSNVFTQLLSREMRLLARRPSDLANPLVFFAIVIALFPLAVGPETQLLQTLSPGLLWVAALLAVLLSLDGLFRSDFEDGSLEQWVLSSHPLPLLVLAKVLAHWLFSGLALVLLAPLLALMLGLPGRCLPVLLLSLLLGTPVLSLLGAVGAAHCRVDTTRHPSMHKTQSLDVIVLVKGEVDLLLDNEEARGLKPGDVVIQRATNHGWINRGKETALLVAVLIHAA